MITMLWIALHLPDFPLQIVSRLVPESTPLCLYEKQRGRAVVIAVNAVAQQAGITPGLSLAAARALSSDLRIVERDTRQESKALEALAQWAQQFTPAVSLQPTNGLLLEIGASLSLFHGLNALRARIRQALQGLGHQAQYGIAPTPGAAWLLAQAADERPVTEYAELKHRLAELPARLLPLPSDGLSALEELGITTLGQLFVLPRDGLGRRFGPSLPVMLEQILGQSPDPRPFHRPPSRFERQLTLPEPAEQTGPLLFLLRRLLHELAGFLRGRGAGTLETRLTLSTTRHPADELRLKLITPSNDPAHLLKLWQEKLERHHLSAPVESLTLTATTVVKMTPKTRDLFTSRSDEEVDFTAFLERLRARLGDEAIHRFEQADDHRPENASRQRRWDQGLHHSGTGCPSPRPVWLLEPALALGQEQKPLLDGTPLEPTTPPERIETGWWDSNDTRRDYYIIRTPRHQTLWIYRERQGSKQWFMHGYFA